MMASHYGLATWARSWTRVLDEVAIDVHRDAVEDAGDVVATVTARTRRGTGCPGR